MGKFLIAVALIVGLNSVHRSSAYTLNVTSKSALSHHDMWACTMSTNLHYLLPHALCVSVSVFSTFTSNTTGKKIQCHCLIPRGIVCAALALSSV